MGELKNENVVLSTEMMQPGSKLSGSGFGFLLGGGGGGEGKERELAQMSHEFECRP